MDKKILITGSAGFIGRSLLEELDADGIDLKEGTDACDEIKGDYGVIVHLAAYMKGEEDLRENNLNSTVSVVQYCKQTGAKLIFASSAAVYGQAGFFPTPEDFPLNPIDDYGVSKLECEQYIEQVLTNYAILRLANVYPKEDSVVGKFQKGENVIFGDGSNVRDYIHVGNVVRAIITCTFNPISGTYNISSGTGKSTNEVFREISKKSPVYADFPKEEIRVSILDNTKWRRVENQYL